VPSAPIKHRDWCLEIFSEREKAEGRDYSISRDYQSAPTILARFLETSRRAHRVVFAREIFEYLYHPIKWAEDDRVIWKCMWEAMGREYGHVDGRESGRKVSD